MNVDWKTIKQPTLFDKIEPGLVFVLSEKMMLKLRPSAGRINAINLMAGDGMSIKPDVLCKPVDRFSTEISVTPEE